MFSVSIYNISFFRLHSTFIRLHNQYRNKKIEMLKFLVKNECIMTIKSMRTSPQTSTYENIFFFIFCCQYRKIRFPHGWRWRKFVFTRKWKNTSHEHSTTIKDLIFHARPVSSSLHNKLGNRRFSWAQKMFVSSCCRWKKEEMWGAKKLSD